MRLSVTYRGGLSENRGSTRVVWRIPMEGLSQGIFGGNNGGPAFRKGTRPRSPRATVLALLAAAETSPNRETVPPSRSDLWGQLVMLEWDPRGSPGLYD